MKKIIGVFLTMVFMFVIIGMNIGTAENPKKEDFAVNEIESMIDDWVRCQKQEKYYSSYTFENGIYYTKGVVNGNYFKELYGDGFSARNMEDLYYNNQKYGEGNWDIVYANVKLIGFINGYDVYILNMKSNEVPLGECECEDYYQVSVIFMVMEEA